MYHNFVDTHYCKPGRLDSSVGAEMLAGRVEACPSPIRNREVHTASAKQDQPSPLLALVVICTGYFLVILLIAARFVQGAGAAVLVPSSLVLLQAAYLTRAQRSRALGVWGRSAGSARPSGRSSAGCWSVAGAGAGCSSSTCP